MKKTSLIKIAENLSEEEKLEMFKVEELETRLEMLIPIDADGACFDGGCFEDAVCDGSDVGCIDGNCNDGTCNGSCDGSCGGW